MAAALTGYAVVHLHGGLAPAVYDGWAENLMAPGQTTVFHYPNDQRSALLWYHDHVMSVTKYDVYSGLAGMWIIRDERERELALPEGPPLEVPLLIQDRNFDVDEQGRLTYSGRYMYHCHILEHEDRDMMRPFVTMPPELMPFMA
jgi:spore coat protein A